MAEGSTGGGEWDLVEEYEVYERACGAMDFTECGMLFFLLLPVACFVLPWLYRTAVKGTGAGNWKDGFTKVAGKDEQSVEVNPVIQNQSVEVGVGVETRSKEVHVDWHEELGPDSANDAQLYAMCQRAAYTLDADGKRVLIDMEEGWQAHRGDDVRSYPTFCTSLEELTSIGGVGIRVYFEFLWRLPCLFFALAVLNTPSLYLNYYCCEHDAAGRPSMYANRNITRQYRTTYAKTTLGSLAASHEELDSGAVGSLYVRTVLDGLSVLVMFCFVIHWTRARAKISEEADNAMASMSDYTVRIRAKKPWDATREDTDTFKTELQDFLSEYGSLSSVGGNRTVELAYAEYPVILATRKKTAMLADFETELAKLRLSEWKETPKFQKKLDALARHSKKLHRLNTEKKWHVIEAYATFEEHTAAEACVAAFESSEKPWEFKERELKVTVAPEPEVLIWEHMEYNEKSQRMRRRITFCAGVLLLLLGFGAVVSADIMKGNLDYLASCTDAMSIDAPMPGLYCDPFTLNKTEPLRPKNASPTDALSHYKHAFENTTEAAGTKFPKVMFPKANFSYCNDVNEDGVVEHDCSDNKFRCSVTQSDDMDGCCSEKSSLSYESAILDNRCHRVDRDGDVYPFADRDSICYMCICDCAHTLVEGDPSCPDIPTVDSEGPHQAKARYCKAYTEYRSTLSKWKTVATCLTVAINYFVKYCVIAAEPLQRHHTSGAEQGSIAFRVFLCQLVNTAVLIIILRADLPLPVLSDSPTQKFSNVTAKWYSVVAAPLIKTMLINFISQSGLIIYKAFIKRFTLLVKKVIKGPTLGALTQNELNHKYDGTDWNLAASCGEMYLNVFVCLMYASGVPALLWVATFGFTIKYIIDKWAVLNFYKKPPLYDDALFSAFGGISHQLLIALGLHGLLGVWFYGSAGGTNPKVALHLHALRPHVIPFLVVLFTCTAIFAKMKITGRWKELKTDGTASGDAAEELKPFSQAYASGILVNEDDDYSIDTLERLEQMEVAFEGALQRESGLVEEGGMSVELQTKIQLAIWPNHSSGSMLTIDQSVEADGGDEAVPLAVKAAI